MSGQWIWYTHNGDRQLASALGLRETFTPTRGDAITGGCSGGFIDVGTAELRDGHDIEPYARVKVEVDLTPAQFYRFTVEVLLGDGYDAVLTTGSGGLSTFWPTVLLFAQGMLQISPTSTKKAAG